MTLSFEREFSGSFKIIDAASTGVNYCDKTARAQVQHSLAAFWQADTRTQTTVQRFAKGHHNE